MRLAKAALALMSLHAVAALLLLPRGVSADGECGKVRCGMGSCSESGDYAFGFACRCNPGWSRFSVGDTEFPFLSCVIPNCTINNSCRDEPAPPAPSLPPPVAPSLTNLSIYDPCLLQYCGGGSCEKAAGSGFAHRCACRDGFRNLLDDDAYPCYRQCSLGTDCSGLGINILNGSDPNMPPPAPVSFTIQKSGAAAGSSPPAHRLLVLLMLVSFFWFQTVL
ncbi:uncharacterized protein LOC104584953 [Brachypodium distachyon]|uniref:EGF-like domain-containing protein n=1 Tax=Brachypodium distachyon TaxID=15368 RepID=A0A0Q3L609_BRADI|nr:uncharacterized protein LOC104584953 [Brachypodium distachyon]KQJ88077.1 hypothetical protein BRADI_4g15170v3 [Brachypodium distachyon]|eukprot:XP_014757399.1 uncharacterized protein LOC104584953 [Brachypodium distachyon]